MPNIENDNLHSDEGKLSNNDNGKEMGRREFLKLAGATVAGAFVALNTPKGVKAAESVDSRDFTFLESGPDEITALGAVVATVKEFNNRSYTWERTNLQYSDFVGQYMGHLGFQIGRDNTDISLYKADITKPMPETTVVKQVQYLDELNKNLGGDLIADIPLKQMLGDKNLWQQIPPGTVMYLPELESKNRYDTYSDTAVFIGLDSNKEPRFAQFSGTMQNGAEYGHGFSQFSKMYRGKNVEPKISANNELKVLMFDAVEASRRFGLEHGVVTPDGKLFAKLGYDNVITININDGRLSMWEITKSGARKQRLGEKEEMFTVVGKKLKKNKYLSNEYWEKMEELNPSTIYDSLSGCHIDKEGIRRTTYTPPLIAELIKTGIIENFGHLGPETYTDICLLKQVYFGKNESKVLTDGFSAYTLHDIPRNTQSKQISVREPALKIANTTGKPVEEVNLSAGCVNLDGDSWSILKGEIKKLQDSDKKISIMFSTPRINQKKIIKLGDESSSFHATDPLGGQVNRWGYSQNSGIGYDEGISLKRNKEYPLFKENLTNTKEILRSNIRKDPFTKNRVINKGF